MIENPYVRYPLLLLATGAVVGGILWLQDGPKSGTPEPPANLPVDEAGLPSAADFAGATGWLNTPNNASLELVGLRGHVVLVDFWTYSCINCIHTLPHVTKLYDTYAPYGLVVVGVHTPEFSFEKKRPNVADAIVRYGIHYPVAQDNADGIWNAYHNTYWPAHYVIDQYGKVRFTHAGEGDYAATEQQVRSLLRELNATRALPDPIEVSQGDFGQHTGELYAAAGRSAVGNRPVATTNGTATYEQPATHRDGAIDLGGTWRLEDQDLVAVANATVRVQFHGVGANLVADGPAGACVAVTLDGAPLPESRSAPDATPRAGQTCVVLDGARSYDVYAGPREAHVLGLDVPVGFRLYTFDFT